MKETYSQFIKFSIIGILNTLVDWFIFFLITSFLIKAKNFEPIVKSVAFICAVVNSYIFNTLWTFKKEYNNSIEKTYKNKKRIIFSKFILVSLIGWTINLLVFNYFRFNLNSTKLLALIFASGFALIWNFIANKIWTYRK